MNRHLKSIVAPKSWTLLRKETKYITRPSPGAHSLARSLPVGLLLKQLGYAQTTREAKKILNEKNVFVDGKVVKDRHFGVGFMDVVQLKDAKKNLRVSLDMKGRLIFIDIAEAESGKKVCRIEGKTVVKGGKLQLNLSDGRNVLVDKDAYAVGDSIVLQVPEQKVASHIALEKDTVVFLMAGRHLGKIGVVDNIEGDRLWFTADGEKCETLKKFGFAVGKEKAVVKLK